MTDQQHWDNVYQSTALEALPWNAGGPDPDLARLLKDGTIPIPLGGHGLDIGTGPGHDAVYMISQGFIVIAMDISRLALKHARENVSRAGLFGFFQSGDIRRIPIEDAYIDFANDRGCFHLLSAEDRPKAVAEIHRVLAKKGLFLLRVFSDQEAPGETPHRFTKRELETLFTPKFRLLDFWEGVFEGPRKAKSYSMLMEKK